MDSMANFFSRFKPSAQSQGPTILVPPNHLVETRKEAHWKTPHSSNGDVMSTRERELSKQLSGKKSEIVGLRGKIARREHEIRSLLDSQTMFQEVSEKKDSDMLELSNSFKVILDERDKKIGKVRGYYSELLHAQEIQQRNIKIVQQSADAEAKALRDKLTTTERELELCKDDLFRMQPVCRISDGNIIAAFESLGEQFINWIDNETSAFEKAYPGVHVEWLFIGSKDPDVACFLRMHPLAGEHLCRYLINHYLLKHMFGSNIYHWGLSTGYTHMRLNIEHGMAALKPSRGTGAHLSEFLVVVLGLIVSDSQTINIWRAETLSALGSTQEYKDLRGKQSIEWTREIFESLSTYCPNLFRREEAMKEFHDQVTIPAMTLVSQLQGLATPYRLDMVEKNFVDCKRFTRDDLSKVIAIDLETGRTLKPSSAIVSDREGVIGDLILPLEPSLHRVNEGTSETALRQETWLVRLDHALGSRAPRGD